MESKDLVALYYFPQDKTQLRVKKLEDVGGVNIDLNLKLWSSETYTGVNIGERGSSQYFIKKSHFEDISESIGGVIGVYDSSNVDHLDNMANDSVYAQMIIFNEAVKNEMLLRSSK